MQRLLLTIAASALAVSASFADPIADREAMMKGFGGSLGQLAPMARGEQPFDSAAVMAALEALQGHAEKFDAAILFPEGSIGDGEALPAIWENTEDFQARADKLKADVEAVMANPPADPAALGAALQQIGGNCGACHEVYRMKKS